MKFQMYQKRRLTGGLQWRWRLRASNGKIIADSAEGYFNQADCMAALQLVKNTGAQTLVEVLARPKPGPKTRSMPR
jgi:uncharacterized protein YegP (UPF0339 family)